MAEGASGGCVIDTARSEACRDTQAAAHLKLVSICVIFATSALGICAPVVMARLFRGSPVYDKAIHVIKCFAAGVILATALVHVLPDAFDALGDCQVASHHPWKDFPFAGLVTLIGALLALFVDITATSHLHGAPAPPYAPIGTGEDLARVKLGEPAIELGNCGHEKEIDEVELTRMKQRLVSQVLEIGIIFHSVIIGVTMGMSQNRCTIKPLIAALAFHQIFEGMGLGGCIAQAGFRIGTVAYMCLMFSVTTPMGIVLGMIVFRLTGYDDSSPGALISEGLLGSISSGVLIYMALVDLISADFFHNKMTDSNPWLRKASYIALIAGSAIMSFLALWA